MLRHLSLGGFLRRQVICSGVFYPKYLRSPLWRIFLIAFQYLSNFREISALLDRITSFPLVLISLIELHLEARVELVINTVWVVLVNPRCLWYIRLLGLFALGCSRQCKVGAGRERVGRHFRYPVHLLAHLSAYLLFGSGRAIRGGYQLALEEVRAVDVLIQVRLHLLEAGGHLIPLKDASHIVNYPDSPCSHRVRFIRKDTALTISHHNAVWVIVVADFHRTSCGTHVVLVGVPETIINHWKDSVRLLVAYPGCRVVSLNQLWGFAPCSILFRDFLTTDWG